MTGMDNLRAFLDEHGQKLAAVTHEDSGTPLLLKLIGHRTHQVYAIASQPWPADSVDLVHDLRVATRRLREALAIASPLIDARKAARADRRAQKLGRKLGERRIADVMIADAEGHFAAALAAVPSLRPALEAERDKGTRRIQKRYPEHTLLRHGAKVLALALNPTTDLRIEDVAGPHLAERVKKVESLIDTIDDEHDKKHHHSLRIRLKRLRYSAEIFSTVFPDRFDEHAMIDPLKDMQDALGVHNDAAELSSFVKKLSKKKAGRDDPAIPPLLVDLVAATNARYAAAKELVHGRGKAAVDALREVAKAITRQPAQS
jgi:CHAD domain-containing protein